MSSRGARPRRIYEWRTFDLLEPEGGWPEPPEHFIGQRAVGDCVEWMGNPNKGGYGQTQLAGTNVGAHVAAWRTTYGPIGQDEKGRTLQVLHACDNPPCARASHLWLGTASDNAADKKVKNRDLALKCKNGHQYTLENTRMTKSGNRQCLKCREAGRLRAQHRRDLAKVAERMMIADLFEPREA